MPSDLPIQGAREITEHFDRVVKSYGELEQMLVKEGKGNIVSGVFDFLAWKKIADGYKPFLILKHDVRSAGIHEFVQLQVVEAETADYVFVAEIELSGDDRLSEGFDSAAYYPLYNAFLEWLKQNQ
jgi:hypothetical protein